MASSMTGRTRPGRGYLCMDSRPVGLNGFSSMVDGSMLGFRKNK